MYRTRKECIAPYSTQRASMASSDPLSPLESRPELYRVCSVSRVSRYRGECWLNRPQASKQPETRRETRRYTFSPCFQGSPDSRALLSRASTLSSPAFKPLYPLYPTQRAIYVYIRLCSLFRYRGSDERGRESRKRE